MPTPALLHLRGHSHNDEMQARPLVGALEAGLGSIEADLHLVDGKLLVGHDDAWARAHGLTLEATYLAPLAERVKQTGGVYGPGSPVVLLLDFKTTDPARMYAALQPLLAKYSFALSSYTNGRKQQGAIDVVVTGNEPRSVVEGPGPRQIALDGSMLDLEQNPSAVSPEKTPQLNASFRSLFRWDGSTPMSDEERDRLRGLVEKAHQRKVRLRFWDAPDNPLGWTLLEDAGVDYVNTDHPAEFASWQDQAGHAELPTP